MAQKSAEELAKQAKAISVSEFFEKNRHLLGYDNKIKALLIIVKEAVDNAIDATEEARILPEVSVKVQQLGDEKSEKYKLVIKDNGPGIVKNQIPKIFGTLLYGSKFHRLRQSRGSQGLGISCAVMYSQLTTGEAAEIVSSTGDGVTHRYKLKIDVKKNEPDIIEESEDRSKGKWHGLQIAFICEGQYREHKQGVLEYLKQTAIANPFATITAELPSGHYDFKRAVTELPREPQAIQPHLYGVEVGVLARMLQDTRAQSLKGFLTSEFSRVGATSAEEICKLAKLDPATSPRRLEDKDVVKIVEAVKQVKLTRPPTDCLSPLGEGLIEKGLKKELKPEFAVAVTRPAEVYRGWPFQVEVGIAWGGEIAEPRFMRVANRVPLLYQAGDCAITKAIADVDWKRYGIEMDKMPTGPVAIFVHVFSVWVPFTSESKEAVASYDVISKEIKLGLQEAARKLSIYLSGIRRAQAQAQRKSLFERYAGETARAIADLTGEDEKRVLAVLKRLINEKWEESIEQSPEPTEAEVAAEANGKEEE
ncbi:MAG TPA: DNA topoisomerase VI subunit B [archaeon]|nr:DNA topoisomerase VI subunit B [archaeon]